MQHANGSLVPPRHAGYLLEILLVGLLVLYSSAQPQAQPVPTPCGPTCDRAARAPRGDRAAGASGGN